jgi:predicted kinase
MHKSAEVVQRNEPAAMLRVVTDTMNGLAGSTADANLTGLLAKELVARCTELANHLNARCAGGFVRRCHGDLHLRNIVLQGGHPTPFDALEFDDTLATGDVYYDLAFLLMDLEYRGLRPLANRCLGRYAILTDDIEGLAALPFYIALRAAIRARVALLTGRTSADALNECNAHLALALRYLRPAPPRLVAIGGLSGTGKSSVAYAISDGLEPGPGGVVLRSDVARKMMFAARETERLPESAYAHAVTDDVYRSLLRQASRVIAAGYSALVDAVFAQPQQRDAIESVAAKHKVPFSGLWLQASLDARRRRISGRAADASDATVRVAEQQEGFELGEITWHRIDASGPLEDTRRRCQAALAKA